MKKVERTLTVITWVILFIIMGIKVLLVAMLPDTRLKSYLESVTTEDFDQRGCILYDDCIEKDGVNARELGITYNAIIICIYKNSVYYFRMKGDDDRAAVLYAVDLDTRVHREIISMEVPDRIVQRELSTRIEHPNIPYRYCYAYYYDSKIVVQGLRKMQLYDLKTGELSEIETGTLHTLLDDYKSIEIEDNEITIILSNGENRTLTFEKMAKMDSVAKRLYRYSKNKIVVFMPQATMKFERVSVYDNKMYVVVRMNDLGGWGYMLYYQYTPETDDLDFWGGKYISDGNDICEINVIPYAE